MSRRYLVSISQNLTIKWLDGADAECQQLVYFPAPWQHTQVIFQITPPAATVMAAVAG